MKPFAKPSNKPMETRAKPRAPWDFRAMPSATAFQKSASPIRPKKNSQMPAKFSLSFSARWNLARSRRHDFPASPVFSQLESCHCSNLVRGSLVSTAEFDRAMRHRALRGQEAKPLDSNFQHSSLQITAQRFRVPSLNRLASLPQNSCASQVCSVTGIQPRIRFHVTRIPSMFDRFCQSDYAATIRSLFHFRSPNFTEYCTTIRPMVDWPKTTSLA